MKRPTEPRPLKRYVQVIDAEEAASILAAAGPLLVSDSEPSQDRTEPHPLATH